MRPAATLLVPLLPSPPTPALSPVLALPVSIGLEVGAAIAGQDVSSGYPAGVSVLWPTSRLRAGQALVRDWLPSSKQTLSWAIRLTTLLSRPDRWGQGADMHECAWVYMGVHGHVYVGAHVGA